MTTGKRLEKFSIRLCAAGPKNAEDLSKKFAATIKTYSPKSNRFCHRTTVPRVLWKRPPLPKLRMLLKPKQRNSKWENVSGVIKLLNKSARAGWVKCIWQKIHTLNAK